MESGGQSLFRNTSPIRVRTGHQECGPGGALAEAGRSSGLLGASSGAGQARGTPPALGKPGALLWRWVSLPSMADSGRTSVCPTHLSDPPCLAPRSSLKVPIHKNQHRKSALQFFPSSRHCLLVTEFNEEGSDGSEG